VASTPDSNVTMEIRLVKLNSDLLRAVRIAHETSILARQMDDIASRYSKDAGYIRRYHRLVLDGPAQGYSEHWLLFRRGNGLHEALNQHRPQIHNWRGISEGNELEAWQRYGCGALQEQSGARMHVSAANARHRK
jgi:hypothetical protein